MDVWTILLDIVLLLAGALLLGGVCSRLGQSPLVGYLLAGMLLGGPGSIRLVREGREIETVAELGVSLLLFSLGLEFSWARLMDLGRPRLISGAIQVAATAVIGALLAVIAGVGVKEAAAVGMMIALSSTACVVRVLLDERELDSVHGRSSLAILLVQDMAVVPLALLMTLLAEGGAPGEVLLRLGRIVLLAGALVAGLYLLLNKLAVRALGSLTLEQNRELTVLLAVVTGLGAAWAAHAAGLSPALGAFLAGMFLGGSPFATQIRADVASLRVVLLTLFFGAAGMVGDPQWMLFHAHWVLLATAALIALKSGVIWAVLRRAGQSHVNALATGLCLAQIGEFAFVLGSIGRSAGLVSDEVYQLVVSTTITTLVLTAYQAPAAPALARWLIQRLRWQKDEGFADQAAADAPPPAIVIIGFGPAGRHVADALRNSGLTVVVLDLNPQATIDAETYGFHGHIGDTTQLEVLEHARLASARLVVITIPARSAALTTLAHVRNLAPAAHVIVRSRYDLHLADFRRAGAHQVVGDEQEVGHGLAALVREKLPELISPPESPASATPGPQGTIAPQKTETTA